MAKITWLQIFATIFQLITPTSGTCNETNVGIRDELKVIPDASMTASSNNGSDFLPEFGRLQGMNAWCPNISADESPVYLQIDLGQKYVICGVEAQGLPGASVRTGFTLSFSNNGSTFTDFNSNQQFDGSEANGDVSDFHELPSTITAQYIRFKPVSNFTCLRVEVYGTPEGVEVTCNQNEIQVQINRSAHDGLDPNDLRLIDDNCLPSSSNESINFNITLGTCGTLVVFSTDGVKSFYRNEIINNSTNTTEFDVICSYIREPTQLGTDNGSFIFSMAIFTDENFTIPVSLGSPIPLRTDLFFKIDVETSDADVDLHLRKCRATNNDQNDPNGYVFIENGCQRPNESFVSGYNCNKTTTSQDFVLSVFRFAGSAPGDLIFFHCDVVLCLISTVNSLCSTECAACSSVTRKKRAVEDYSRKDLVEKHLVLGPYKIIDNSDGGNNGNDDENASGGRTKGEDPSETIVDSENSSITMVIIICVSSLVVVAIVIGLLVMIRLSQSSRGPAVKDITADLARDNLAFDELEVKTLSMKSSEKPISS